MRNKYFRMLQQQEYVEQVNFLFTSSWMLQSQTANQATYYVDVRRRTRVGKCIDNFGINLLQELVQLYALLQTMVHPQPRWTETENITTTAVPEMDTRPFCIWDDTSCRRRCLKSEYSGKQLVRSSTTTSLTGGSTTSYLANFFANSYMHLPGQTVGNVDQDISLIKNKKGKGKKKRKERWRCKATQLLQLQLQLQPLQHYHNQLQPKGKAKGKGPIGNYNSNNNTRKGKSIKGNKKKNNNKGKGKSTSSTSTHAIAQELYGRLRHWTRSTLERQIEQVMSLYGPPPPPDSRGDVLATLEAYVENLRGSERERARANQKRLVWRAKLWQGAAPWTRLSLRQWKAQQTSYSDMWACRNLGKRRMLSLFRNCASL